MVLFQWIFFKVSANSIYSQLDVQFVCFCKCEFLTQLLLSFQVLCVTAGSRFCSLIQISLVHFFRNRKYWWCMENWRWYFVWRLYWSLLARMQYTEQFSNCTTLRILLLYGTTCTYSFTFTVFCSNDNKLSLLGAFSTECVNYLITWF